MKRQGGRVSQPARQATVTPRSTLGVPPAKTNGTTPCMRRYEIGDGTVDRCALEKGHDGWHRATQHKSVDLSNASTKGNSNE